MKTVLLSTMHKPEWLKNPNGFSQRISRVFLKYQIIWNVIYYIVARRIILYCTSFSPDDTKDADYGLYVAFAWAGVFLFNAIPMKIAEKPVEKKE